MLLAHVPFLGPHEELTDEQKIAGLIFITIMITLLLVIQTIFNLLKKK